MRLKQARLVLTSALTALALFPCLQGCADLTGGVAQQTTATKTSGESAASASTTTTTLSQAEIALSGMTLREKVAQVLLLTFSGTALTQQTAELLADGPPGGLLILGHNVIDAVQVRDLTRTLQQTAAATGSAVGLFIAVDQEGGKVQRIKQGVPELPSARKMGTESTPSKAYYMAVDTARGLRAQGINMNLSPVADVVTDEDSFLYGRTYSGDPALVSKFVTAVIEAHREQGLIAVVKHFPGHGSASGNTHTDEAVSDATRSVYERVHLAPFRAAISVDVEGVMVAHIVATPYDPANPASLSKTLIEDLLRGRLGFEGLVMADDLSMAAALEHVALDPAVLELQSETDSDSQQTPGPTPQQIEEQILIAKEVQALVTALDAGCDLLILAELETRTRAVLDGLVAAVEQGAVSQARLDEAVLRILELKYRHDIVAVEITQPTPTLTQKEGT